MKKFRLPFALLVIYYFVVIFSLRGAIYYSFGNDVGILGPFLFVIFLHTLLAVYLLGNKQ